MKHEVTTMNTKRALAAALKKLASDKPFSKITVSELIAECGVNRKTFYYHFEDIYALLKWLLEQEAIDVVSSFDLISDYEQAIYFVMNYVEENNRFLLSVYNSVNRDVLKHFFYVDFIGIVESVVNDAEKLCETNVSPDFKEFLAQFYTEALVGVLVDWIVSYRDRDRAQTICYIKTVIQAGIPNALRLANNDMSDYITTYTGAHIVPTEPKAEYIHLADIAHALSLICRGNGHVKTFFSVGQHCINCALEAEARGFSDRVVFACLLHDASEAYMSDVPRPLKKHMPKYKEYESHLLDVIYTKYLGSPLTAEEAALVKTIDDDMLYFDLRELLNEEQTAPEPKLMTRISYDEIAPSDIEKRYLAMARSLCAQNKPV